MNKIKLIAGIVLALFLGLHGIALYEAGFLGLFRIFTEVNAWSAVLVADLTISLGLAISWMVSDAKKRGTSALPYVILTLTLGSVGTLLYLMANGARTGEARASMQPTTR